MDNYGLQHTGSRVQLLQTHSTVRQLNNRIKKVYVYSVFHTICKVKKICYIPSKFATFEVMKIIYFHGFASSGATGTVQLLRQILPEDEILAPDIPMDPAEALPFLKEYVAAEQPDLIVGTSMGGMYAQQMRGFRKICVNPAFNMSRLSKVLKPGTFKYLNGRKDNEKEFKITKETVQHYFVMERSQFDGITDWEKENTWGLFGIRDEHPSCYDLFKKHYPQAARYDGGHQLNEKALRAAVLPLISDIRKTNL